MILYKIIFYFIFSSLLVQGQVTPAIKIYLEDAYNGKNIGEAKVTLEGFEIPEIVGKYDKKGKYYYFNEIPEGYNTVMAYHKKYNEKGFQDIDGLPKKLRLKLYTPYRIKLDEKFYKEDDKNLIIKFREEILQNKEINISEGFKNYIANHFPELEVIHSGRFGVLGDFMVKKRNDLAFKRFNDPTIKKLDEDKNIIAVYGLMLKTANSKKTYFLEDGTPVFAPTYRRYADADFVIQTYENWKNSHYTQLHNFKFEQLKEYYDFLTENHLTSNVVIKIDEELKKNILEYRNHDLYVFSTYTGDTLISRKSNYFRSQDISLLGSDTTETANNLKSIMDIYDPYIIISNLINDDMNTYYLSYNHKIIRKSKKLKVVFQEKLTKKMQYKFEGIVSPFGTVDLFDYYKEPR